MTTEPDFQPPLLSTALSQTEGTPPGRMRMMHPHATHTFSTSVPYTFPQFPTPFHMSSGYLFCFSLIGVCIFLQLAMLNTIERSQKRGLSQISGDLIELWAVTLAFDFFVAQPTVMLAFWLWRGFKFDPSWALIDPTIEVV